jgi:hypothetical protein
VYRLTWRLPLLTWLRLATSSSARFGAASPTQLCERLRASSIGHAVDAMQQGLPWGGKLRQFRREVVHMPASRKLWKGTRIGEGRIESDRTPQAAAADRTPQPGVNVAAPEPPA